MHFFIACQDTTCTAKSGAIALMNSISFDLDQSIIEELPFILLNNSEQIASYIIIIAFNFMAHTAGHLTSQMSQPWGISHPRKKEMLLS